MQSEQKAKNLPSAMTFFYLVATKRCCLHLGKSSTPIKTVNSFLSETPYSDDSNLRQADIKTKHEGVQLKILQAPSPQGRNYSHESTYVFTHSLHKKGRFPHTVEIQTTRSYCQVSCLEYVFLFTFQRKTRIGKDKIVKNLEI